jgi:probable HAF family extracellular repeat protein
MDDSNDRHRGRTPIHRGRTASTLLLMASAGLAPQAAIAQTFTGLGLMSGGSYSIGVGVSGDGRVVVGDADSTASGANGHAFRWTAAGGFEDLGTIPTGLYSYAYGANADGSVVVGYGGIAGTYQAFRWTSETGMVGLGTLPGGTTSICYGAVSADGSIVAGGSATNGTNASRAFRWTQATGMVSIGTLPGGSSSYAEAITPDGSVIVGTSDLSQGIQTGNRAFRWTSGGGMQNLGWLNGWDTNSFGVSADGTTVVGYGGSPTGSRGTRWTAATGQVGIGVLPDEVYSYGYAANSNGSVVVGSSGHGVNMGGSFLTPIDRAVMWTADSGLVDLNQYLPTLGIDLSGWIVRECQAITPDGRTIVGTGEHNGVKEAWIATIPGPACYANCDGSTTAPILNVGDFTCFLQKFASGDPYANCDHSTAAPTLNVADFTCFLQKYAAGCS